MNAKEILNKTKDFCIDEYKRMIMFGGSPNDTASRCFGAVMFSLNTLLKYDSPEGHDLAAWWDDEMHAKFRKKGAY